MSEEQGAEGKGHRAKGIGLRGKGERKDKGISDFEFRIWKGTGRLERLER